MNMTQIVVKQLAIILLLSFPIGSPPSARSDPLQSLVASNTDFGLNLYGQLATKAGNVFFSPYSISTCLAMTYAGASGDTEEQMAQALGFGTDQQQFSLLFGELQRDLEAIQEQNAIELKIANALWTQDGYPFAPTFLEIARGQYHASVNQADFTTGAAAATEAINGWVAQETHDKIQNILPPGSLNQLTRLVLANAIYFKGVWAVSFEKTNTSIQPFYLSNTSQVGAPLMHQPVVDHYMVNYMETSEFQAVELPYGSNQLSMVILLPWQVDGCGQLEQQLSAAFLSGVLSQLRETKVEIFLPRFTVESFFALNEPLAEMGMPAAFTPGVADFSGIDGMTDLFISSVFHKAWGQVNEAGTEAAAATVVAVTTVASGPGPKDPPPVFRADHPFIFFIRDAQSGSLLFLGRLADPSQSPAVTNAVRKNAVPMKPRIPASAW
jgi:serpin B